MDVWLVLDCNYLCHRAMHSTGLLKYAEDPTGVTFGLMREVVNLRARFNSSRFAFCWDHGKGLREQTYPWYKETRRRRRLTDEEEAAYANMRAEVHRLKTEVLRECGFKNVFYQTGMEADDVIAKVVARLPDGHRAVVVSADQDLYQLLSKTVAIHRPSVGGLYTAKDFRKEFGIPPRLWPRVKALAGCSTDDVPGVYGVAEKTAAKFVAGTLDNHKLKDCRRFVKSEEYRRNLSIVTLPYLDLVKDFTPVEDEMSRDGWSDVCERYGFRSLDNSWRPGLGVR